MIAYILKSSFCFLIVWGFYKIFLEKENIHNFKRYYLLFCIIFSYTIPLITFTYQVDIPQESVITDIPISHTIIDMPIHQTVEKESLLPSILWFFYGVIALILGIRFTNNIRKIIVQIRSNDTFKESTHTNVLLHQKIVPHTFLNYIFVPKNDFKNNLIPDEVLYHEKAHVSQKHTLDILFVELMQVAFWFNPLFIFLKKSIKLNHEFLADQNVLNEQFSIQNYFHILVNYPSSPNQTELSSPINYSLTKKRLQMMTKDFSKKRVAIKLIGLLPIAILCVFLFNNAIIAKERTLEIPTTELVDVPSKHLEFQKKAIHEEFENINNSQANYTIQQDIQDGITKEMLTSYNNWAKKAASKKDVVIRLKELQKMEKIYAMMTSEQRASAEKFPKLPPTPPVPPSTATITKKISVPSQPVVAITAPAPIVPKGEKSKIPSPVVPKKPSEIHQSNYEIHFSENSNLTDLEKEAEIERIEAILEEKRAEHDIAVINTKEIEEHAELQELHALEMAEQARLHQMKAMEMAQEALEETEFTRKMTVLNKKELRKIAKEAREIALEERNKVREEHFKEREKARERAEKNREKAMETAHRAREIAFEKREKNLEHIRKIREERMMALEKSRNARKKIPSSRQSATNLIIEMNEKEATFFYRKKEISFEKALKLVKSKKNNLSIDAKTKNGISKVYLRNYL